LVGVPSSSTVSEPRRSGNVPSSTTVTPGRDPLPDHTGEGRGLLAVEVALEPMPTGLVQHHPGPSRAENDGHLSRRRRHRAEIDQRLTQRLIDLGFQC